MNAATTTSSAMEEAALWAARRTSGEFSAADEAELDTWLQADPAHRAAFEQIMGTWDSTALAVDSLKLQAAQVRHDALRQRRTNRRSALSLLAASVMIMVVTVYLFTAGPSPLVIETAAETIRTETLADGSVVDLNARSRIEVMMDDDARWVHLTAGEAFFDVAPGVDRPFTVVSGDVSIRVTGTAFNVRNRGDAVDLIVSEGSVSAADNAGHNLRVGAGQTVTFGDGDPVLADAAGLGGALDWRSGQFVFEETPLAEAVAELNAYYATDYRLGDPALGHLTLSGIFNRTDPAPLLQALKARYPGLEITRTDATVLISSNPQ